MADNSDAEDVRAPIPPPKQPKRQSPQSPEPASLSTYHPGRQRRPAGVLSLCVSRAVVVAVAVIVVGTIAATAAALDKGAEADNLPLEARVVLFEAR